MLTVEQYLAAVLGLVGDPLPIERVPLAQALGRVLADDVPALVAVPPFDNSAMDGFAVRASDVAAAPVSLRVVGESAAASGAIAAVEAGCAVRVMTGGRVPPGADAVVPVESTDQPSGPAPLPQRVLVTEPVPPGRHVRRAAEDLPAGEVVLRAGGLVTPAAIAAAAAVGHGSLPVRRRPRVAVVATGAELVEAGEPLAAGQIPDSNSAMLAALATQAGAAVVACRRSGDDPAELAALLAALPPAELILTSGGVSAGAYEPLRQLGAGLEFCAVAMQPGKPQGHGRVDGVPLLAFPGNPVSSFVSFQVFGRPLLDALCGRRREGASRRARAAVGWASPPGRRQYLPVTFEPDGTLVRPSHRRGSGSHLIASLHRAEGLAVVDEQTVVVNAGDEITVQQLG